MSTVRHYLDTGFITAPSIMTDDDQHEIRCGMCARELYVDDVGLRLYLDVLNSGLDNPFLCEICSEE